MINKKTQKKHLIRIPQNVSIYYCNKKQFLIISGSLRKLALKLDVKIFIEGNIIEVSDLPFRSISNVKLKKIKALRGATIAKIKQLILETTGKFYQNLKFIGVGYRAFSIEGFETKLFMFKLGFSHLIYFRIPTNYLIKCQKFTKLYISGDFYEDTEQLTAWIRECKQPEPYKGKGILYQNEKINLKIGKRPN